MRSTAERRIGPYKLLRELGHGGMGTVFLAARADDQFQKRVAIKLIRAGADNEEVVRHFRRERQILASIEHPNIARLLDGGSTEDGLPYFVMEYIEGRGLLEHCDSQGLTTNERLRLFQEVCSAVEHAHRNLIIHRDIKPGNILVSPEGVPKLLDFGIAKLLSPGLRGEASSVTQAAFTPEYASPEHVRGEPLTTATDVYSLGVVLYQLLTGRTPYRVTSRQPLDLLRAVVEEEPEKPSTAVDREAEAGAGAPPTAASGRAARNASTEKLRKRLRGDLDTIVLTALRKEPRRRYPSVEALSADIGRYLAGLPVAARKGTWGYRAGKFIRRNALGVGVGVAAVMLLTSFAVAMAIQSARTRRALESVEKERVKTERVSSFLIDLFKVSDPSEARGKSITARELLDAGSAKLGRDLEDQPEVRATLMHTVGRVYGRLGLYDRALPLLRESLETRKKLLGDEHLDVAATQSALANVLLAKGDYAECETLYRQALAVRRKILGYDHPDVADSLNNLGRVRLAEGDLAGAETLFQEGLALRRKLLGNEHPDVATSLGNVAIVRYRRGDFAGAVPLYREALALRRKVLGPDHPDVARDLSNLGEILRTMGDLAGAESLHREALALRRKLLGSDHPELTQSLNSLGQTLWQKGEYAEAEALHREALDLSRKRLGDHHPDVAVSRLLLAYVLDSKGDRAGAEEQLREALAIFRTLGDDHPFVAQGLESLAEVLGEKGDHAGAEQLYREALARRRKLLGNDHPDVATTLVELGSLLTDTGRAQQAEPLLREGLTIRRKAFPADHRDVAIAENALGYCETRLGHLDEAEALLSRSYQVLASKRGETSALTRQALERLVRLYQASGRPDRAAEYQGLLHQGVAVANTRPSPVQR